MSLSLRIVAKVKDVSQATAPISRNLKSGNLPDQCPTLVELTGD